MRFQNAIDALSRPRLTKGQIRLGLKFLPGTQGDLGELHVYVKNATDLNMPLAATGAPNDKNLVNAVVKTYVLVSEIPNITLTIGGYEIHDKIFCKSLSQYK